METVSQISLATYGIGKDVKGKYSEIINRVKEALKSEGFGVLTEIDVKATLKKKIDVDVPDQVILGACNPGFAHKAMEVEPDLGLLLPCNVVVRQISNGEYRVSTVDPEKMLSVVGRDDIQPIAREIKNKLKRAIESL